MPFMVQLHVVAAFTALAAFPFTTVAVALIAAIVRVAGRVRAAKLRRATVATGARAQVARQSPLD